MVGEKDSWRPSSVANYFPHIWCIYDSQYNAYYYLHTYIIIIYYSRFFILFISVVIAIALCCCIKFRVPRTKQQIEANYQRRIITQKFRQQLEKIQNSQMDSIDLKTGSRIINVCMSYFIYFYKIHFLTQLTFQPWK